MNTHPTTEYIYHIWGQQFGALILAGYGLEPGNQDRKLHLTEVEDGVEIDWVIELVGNDLPCQDDPLVLAALLKLLLCRPSISHCLEFELGELLTALQWPDDLNSRRQAETAIVNYVHLLYDKRIDAQRRRNSGIAEGGCYHLLTGYVRAKSRVGGVQVRTLRSVYFDTHFIEALKRGQIYFVGIDFGALQHAGDETTNSRQAGSSRAIITRQ